MHSAVLKKEEIKRRDAPSEDAETAEKKLNTLRTLHKSLRSLRF
jgi:hypothetical protein